MVGTADMASPCDIRRSLPLLLSLNAGYVDTAGYLALQGLFSAHVTGNFATLGASLALGTSGAIAKVVAKQIRKLDLTASPVRLTEVTEAD
jgi:uncharacterized membrane protein YoaK (UPF0700 family)